MKTRTADKIFVTLAATMLLYMAVSTVRYRVSNPELTQTQLFLRIPAALSWP
jgi:hypothetical protein